MDPAEGVLRRLDSDLASAKGSTGLALVACDLIRRVIRASGNLLDARAGLGTLEIEFNRRRPARGAALNAFVVVRAALASDDQSWTVTAENVLNDYSRHLRDAPFQASEHILESLGHVHRIATLCSSRFVLASAERLIRHGNLVSALVLESRPGFEGWDSAEALKAMGAEVTLVVDSALHLVLGDVDAVLTGADLVAGDGSVVNRIGTSPLVDLAHRLAIPAVVVTGVATCVNSMPTAVQPPPRPESITGPFGKQPTVTVLNFADDVTPASRIHEMVCESGRYAPEEYVQRSIQFLSGLTNGRGER